MYNNISKLEFTVTYMKNGAVTNDTFESFAAAAGCASALDGMTRFINVRVTYKGDDTWSHSGALYKYSRLDNKRVACNNFLIGLVLAQVGA